MERGDSPGRIPGRRRCRRLTVAVLLTLLLGSCGEGGPIIPTLPSGPLAGTWRGWFTSVSRAPRSATLTVLQSGPVVNGFWTIFETDGRTSGTLLGSLVGTTSFLTLEPYDADTCPISMVTLVSATRLHGTWKTLDCDEQINGMFQFTPQ